MIKLSSLIILFFILALQVNKEETTAGTQLSNTSLEFIQKEDGSFSFDTGILRGILRKNGKSTGIVPLNYINDSTSISKGEGLFNHYRVFTKGTRYGYGARRWPSTAKLNSDGGVSVFWAQTPERPFELQGIYSIIAPNVIDLVTIVHAKQNLHDFEVFLASYFNPNFNDSKVLSYQNPGQEEEPIFISAEKELGEWLGFPRDEQALKVISDGRWTLEPHPIDWTIMQYYALPLAIRQDRTTGLTIVVITKQEDCFGIFTPYNDEKHYSQYLSLFGYDIKRGKTAQAHSRLVFLKNPTNEEILQIAKDFILK